MPDLTDLFAEVEGFDWDDHNAGKIRARHGVLPAECEEVFSAGPLVVSDPRHSTAEPRHAAFGATRTGRRLTIVFTIRSGRIRVVTARDQSRKERRELQHAQKAREAREDPALP